MNKQVNVRVLGEICDKCVYFNIEHHGAKQIDVFGRSLMTFDPHCKYLPICNNLVDLMTGKKGEDLDD